jgi:DNA-binding Xre family transcriptional regulator
MIKVTIRQAARRAGIKNAHQLQKLAGISPTMAAYLWRGDKLPELETLDRLCGVLHCELSDLVKRNGHTKAGPQAQAKLRNGKNS